MPSLPKLFLPRTRSQQEDLRDVSAKKVESLEVRDALLSTAEVTVNTEDARVDSDVEGECNFIAEETKKMNAKISKAKA